MNVNNSRYIYIFYSQTTHNHKIKTLKNLKNVDEEKGKINQ